MAKRKRDLPLNTEPKDSGEGHGYNYKPSITIQDIASKGLSTRSLGSKTGRTHHCLSELETKYFHILEWSDKVIDIREQYLLPLKDTLEISQCLGIPHPVSSTTKEYHPFTTDFLIDYEEGQTVIQKARTIKYAEELDKSRVIAKFEIERVYWTEKGIDWGVVTEKDIPDQLVKNIKWISTAKNLMDYPQLSIQTLADIEKILVKHKNSCIPLAEILFQIDEKLQLKKGIALTAFRHLLVMKKLVIDMNRPIDISKLVTYRINNVSIAVGEQL